MGRVRAPLPRRIAGHRASGPQRPILRLDGADQQHVARALFGKSQSNHITLSSENLPDTRSDNSSA
jgi:hypothetical protein